MCELLAVVVQVYCFPPQIISIFISSTPFTYGSVTEIFGYNFQLRNLTLILGFQNRLLIVF